MRWTLVRNKYRAFARHHARLRGAADPAFAHARFQERLRHALRAHRIQTGLYVLVYLSAVAAALAAIAELTGVFGRVTGLAFLAKALRPLVASASGISVAALAGVFLCRKYLGTVEVDLYYYSFETALGRQPLLRSRRPTKRRAPRRAMRRPPTKG